jgi:hypothetical protein
MDPAQDVFPDNLKSDEYHYQFLKKNPEVQWPLGYLYTRLNVIDTKTSALLRVNSTIIGFLGAIVVFLLGRGSEFPVDKRYVLVPIIFLLVVLVTSDILSFQIFRIRFDRIADDADFVRYRRTFYELTARREKIIAWVLRLSFVGELGFVVLFTCLALQELSRH